MYYVYVYRGISQKTNKSVAGCQRAQQATGIAKTIDRL